MTLSALVASDLRINLLGGGLVLLGLVLLAATIAFWRSAVEDPEVLAPLEVMADRRFSRANVARRTSMLDKVRPRGSEADTSLVEPAPVVTLAASNNEVEREPNPRMVRRLRGRESKPAVVREEPVVNASIDPLLSPRNTRE